ncbi:MAG: SCO family protein [Luteolibacter sp.]
MKRKTTVVLFYIGVAIFSIFLLSVFRYLQKREQPDPAAYEALVNKGKVHIDQWFPIAKDLEGVNQKQEKVKLSDLKGKVWLMAEFFAVCPHCAQRNGQELREIAEAFKDHPDFHIVCVSIDPETDTPGKLADYSQALGADPDKWWFINSGTNAETHAYLSQELKFFTVRPRTDPADIAINGRYAHDLGFILVDRNFNVVGKWPLADARSDQARELDPGLYDRLKADLHQRIRSELDKPSTSESR